MACAGLADVINVRVLLAFSAVLLLVVAFGRGGAGDRASGS